MSKKMLLFGLLCSNGTTQTHEKIPALCVVPVADLVARKLEKKESSAIEDYHALPITSTLYTPCKRITQLIYNEPVTILKQEPEQVLIETDWYFLQPGKRGNPSKKIKQFWTLKKNILPLAQITKKYQEALPNNPLHAKSIIGLKEPWYCPETEQSYSIGTRFVIQEENEKEYIVLVYNPLSNQVYKSTIKKNYCIPELQGQTDEERRNQFVSVLKDWAHKKPSIPYVLGGAGFYSHNTKKGEPHSGFDCSGIIRRACSLSGIPIKATNSYSMFSHFQSLPINILPQPGDLVYWKGHIMIISDIKNHLLIEARGYDDGYGFIHEIPLHQQLKGIETTRDLMKAYSTQQPIKRLNNKGKPYQTIEKIKIMRLL